MQFSVRCHGKELVLKARSYYAAEIPDVMAPVISDRCGGNPFYITALVRQAVKQDEQVASEEVLNELLGLDISSGFIWAELSDQIERWMERINGKKITKWILCLAALDPEEKISLERIREELRRREKTDVPLNEIKEVLVKLSRGDLLEYKQFGDWFGKINDPILNEFLKVWGKELVQGQRWSDKAPGPDKRDGGDAPAPDRIGEHPVSIDLDERAGVPEPGRAKAACRGGRELFPAPHKRRGGSPGSVCSAPSRNRVDRMRHNELSLRSRVL